MVIVDIVALFHNKVIKPYKLVLIPLRNMIAIDHLFP